MLSDRVQPSFISVLNRVFNSKGGDSLLAAEHEVLVGEHVGLVGLGDYEGVLPGPLAVLVRLLYLQKPVHYYHTAVGLDDY